MNAEIPVNRFRSQYRIGPDGELVVPMSGAVAARLAWVMAPSAKECRGLILEMRRRTGASRGQLAAFLGVPLPTLRRWEEGRRQPSGAAKRAIWLLHWLFFEVDRPLDAMAFFTWGYSSKATVEGADGRQPTQATAGG